MLAIYGRNGHWKSRAIRLRIGCDWSHVGMLDGEFVIEAIGGVGVRRTPIAEFLARYDQFTVRYLAGDVELARDKIGLDFDDWGIWGLFWRARTWQDQTKWFCSELVALCAAHIDSDYAAETTPKTILMCSRRLTFDELCDVLSLIGIEAALSGFFYD